MPEPELGTVGMMDHFHKTVLEVLLVEAVKGLVRTSRAARLASKVVFICCNISSGLKWH